MPGRGQSSLSESELSDGDGRSSPVGAGGSGGLGSSGGGSALVGQQVRVPKTAELVANQLRKQIVRGDLVEGDALPPEATLLEQFGVSRPTLREAFRVLESEALISVRRGAHGGARVHMPNGEVAARYAALVLEHRGTTLGDIVAGRAAVEAPAARVLAERCTEGDLATLRASLAEAAKAADDQDLLARHDHAFHTLIVQLAGNKTLVVLSTMLTHILDRVAVSRVQSGHAEVSAHKRLVALIEQRDGERAQAFWHEHLTEAADFGKPLDYLG
jgi:DNA-binding FadR family transcriptional regulator